MTSREAFRLRQGAAALSIFIASSIHPVSAQQVVEAFPHLSFQQPVFLTYIPDGSGRIAVVQQNGIIMLFANDTSASAVDTLLDISGLISSSSGEEGLLGLAFDPNFTRNRHFYVDYTAPNPLRTVIERFTALPVPPQRTDNATGFVILEIDQPYTNHNGGMIAFGPDTDFYIGMGDGGAGGDPDNNAQDRTRLLGKILRIDVLDTTATTHYRIPPDNPYAGNTNGYREEIWAYGFRNPWRYSFDPLTGRLWVGDVGQDSWEEVDIVEPGKNYGWRIMEGSHCYNPASGCDTTGLRFPIIDYSHAYGIAITGGYVYRGTARPDLVGAYIYGDYGSGRVWMLTAPDGVLLSDTLLFQLPFSISSFGTDENSELYFVSYSGSSTDKIYRFAPQPAVGVGKGPGANSPSGYELSYNYPNPFNPTTDIQFTIPVGTNYHTSLRVYDIFGREIAVLVNGRQSAGVHTVTFDASNLASGVYFYRLSTGTFTQTRKMIMVK